ncbi:hypothetical protein [Lacipirellula limnantheis]|uniref:Uncharacterized protein n=1 Tax=Lacipirellula limnantheis TaxID=2528024 RepID=A0A517TZR7_9BACT|nr:hypothetical protein [Lacipirellula limnantheis]QDT73868.1 hypothetical protein I41_30590 [Lacipirellula limnantheis]
MSIPIRCVCGRHLLARDDFAGARAECPTCGRTIQIPARPAPPTASTANATPAGHVDVEPLEITEFLDPPTAEEAAAPHPSTTGAPPAPPRSVASRMFEALLDPRSIQWMLMIGGGLCVLGLIVWLVSLGLFSNPHVLAGVLGVGTLAILGAGWYVALRTRFRVAGQALTFLGCVVAPLNLWFYHAQNLVTVDGHLWVGGVICCLLYAATVYVLRDALFMYAFEIGVTLTTLLLLADLGKITDAPIFAFFFMALGLISIHSERAFSPADDAQFPRGKFGLPLFWSGHVQIAVALLTLLGSQLLGWLLTPAQNLFGIQWTGNLLTRNHVLAAGLWLAAVYAYVYSDLVVRRIGLYLGLASASLVMAELTLLVGFDVRTEWILAVMSATALAVNILWSRLPADNRQLTRLVPPVALALSLLPAAAGLILHIRATSATLDDLNWSYETGAPFVVAMLLAAVCNRISAALYRRSDARTSQIYFFLSAACVLVAAAGQLRDRGLVAWSEQAPWLMLIPLAYLVGARLWHGRSAERPLYYVAQAATAVILVAGFLATVQQPTAFVPFQGQRDSLMLGLVFGEAALFYSLAGFFRRRSWNVYLAAAAACGALWQFMGYFGVDASYYTMLYTGLGLGCLVAARALGLAPTTVYRRHCQPTTVLRGRGLAALQCGHGILTVATLAALMQGLAGLAIDDGRWLGIVSIFVTALAAAAASFVSPPRPWRRVYATAAVALAAVGFLRLNILIDLNGWQKFEIFAVVAGAIMLAASHWALFRETDRSQDDAVSLGLSLGSLLVAGTLLTAVLYHRSWGHGPSLINELALLTFTIAMAVTGVAWQIRATTLFGGGALAIYLIVMLTSLAYRPQVAVGVYLAAGGALVFATGIALSVYREKLLKLPEQISKREGIFKILNWR